MGSVIAFDPAKRSGNRDAIGVLVAERQRAKEHHALVRRSDELEHAAFWLEQLCREAEIAGDSLPPALIEAAAVVCGFAGEIKK